MTQSLALMLNSCDKYRDLWPVFLDWFYKNSPVKDIPVYINSESQDYSDPRFQIINVHPPKPVSFSERLGYCVSQVKENYLLSMPEECILERAMDPAKIDRALAILAEGDVASVCLVHIPGKKRAAEDRYFPYVERKYDYRNLISQQAAIWNTKKLRQYIKPGMNPWEYEIYSSARGVLNHDRFFSVIDAEEEVAAYNYGYLVYRGYWCKEEIDRLEAQYGISFDRNARECLPMDEIRLKTNGINLFWIRVFIHKMIIIVLRKAGIRI